MRSDHSETIGHFIFYLIAMAGSAILVLTQGIILRKILAPELYGNFHFFTTFLIYLSSIHLGLVLAAEREIPYLLGKKSIDELRKVQNVTFTTIISLTIVVILVGLAASFLVKPVKDALLVNSFRLILGILLFQEIIIFYETLTRGYRNFSLISRRVFLTSFFNVVFSIILSHFYGLLGALFGLLLASIIMASFYCITYFNKIKIEFEKEVFVFLLKIGLPLLLASLFYTLLTTIDSILVYLKFGAETLGFYTLAPLIFMVSNLVSRVMGIVLYPRFLFQYGEENENERFLYERINKSLRIIIIITSLIIGILFFTIDPFIKLFLPQYSLGIIPAKIILIFSLFLSTVSVQGFFLIAKKQVKAYSIINGLSLAFAVLTIIFTLKFSPNIKNVAFIAGLAYLINGVVMYIFISNQFIKQKTRILVNLVKLYLPFLYALFCIAFSLLITARMSNENLANGIAILIFVLLFSPFFIKIQKEFNLLEYAYGYFKH